MRPESGHDLPTYLSLDAHKAVNAAPRRALQLILRHLSVPPAVDDLLLCLHAAALLRIATGHGLGQPFNMPRGVRGDRPEILLLYVLLWERLLQAQGQRLHTPGGAERGPIQA